MPRSWTHKRQAVFESGHKAPPTDEFLPVMDKTRFAAEAACSRLGLKPIGTMPFPDHEPGN